MREKDRVVNWFLKEKKTEISAKDTYVHVPTYNIAHDSIALLRIHIKTSSTTKVFHISLL